MLTKHEELYYSRQLVLKDFGIEGQRKLRSAKILVIGAGGLGCPALLYLAGAGIGNVNIVDNDTISESNLHRQILYRNRDIGDSKAEVAKQKLEKLNPNISINAFCKRFDIISGSRLIRENDIILDCTDNIGTRYLINDLCKIYKKTFIYAALYGFDMYLSTFNFIRDESNNIPTYRDLFPIAPNEDISNCEVNGVLGIQAGIAGIMQATEAIKHITGMGKTLNGKLLMYNTLTYEQKVIAIPYDANKPDPKLSDYEIGCSTVNKNSKEISVEELSKKIKKGEDLEILDVRSDTNQDKISTSKHIPFDLLLEKVNELDINKPIIIYCLYGILSQKAAGILEEKGFTDIYSLKGGLEKWRSLNKLI